MATTTNKQKIMKLSQAEYETLSTTGTLTKDGVTYTYSPSDTIYVTPDSSSVTIVQTTGSSTTDVMSQNAVTTALAGKENVPITATNITIATTDWVADNTYTGYGYKAEITVQGCTSSSIADVYLNSASAALGIVASFCDEGTNKVTIYSISNESAVTIDKVVVR